MNEIPQGGAGGVPLHHDGDDASRDPRAPGAGPGAEERSTEEQGEATTAEPGRARRLGPDERTGDGGDGGTDDGDGDGDGDGA
ncbi:hypothetical protein ACIQI7_20515 [Kitasatospora sp. NPDC092039]|uniref:hypothetical protein n=1 Tax=Kitasatospora sp. NPDC092039 TaxID=3364086 RepID=UPI003804FF56